MNTIIKKDWDRNNSYAMNINEQNSYLANLKITYQNTRCYNCTLQLYKDMEEKVNIVGDLYELVRKLIKMDNNTLSITYGVCSDFLRKPKYYFLITINE